MVVVRSSVVESLAFSHMVGGYYHVSSNKSVIVLFSLNKALNDHVGGHLSSVVERVAFNHVVVGSIPTDGGRFSIVISLHVLFSTFK